jgi:hypothetical protein
MTSGNHEHYCPICDSPKICPIVTHCALPDVSICFERHGAEQVKGFVRGGEVSATPEDGMRESLSNIVDITAPLTIRLEAARALLLLHDCITASENTDIKYRIKNVRKRQRIEEGS